MRWAGVALVILAVAGCTKRAKPDATSLEISETRTVRTGPVGLGESKARATYALVDVTNPADRAVVAEVVGEWGDAAGNSLGPTLPEILTIPARGTRMFALVDAGRRAVDNAVAVRVRVKGASYAHAEPQVVIAGDEHYTDEGRAVAAGYVENRGVASATAMVVAGFYGPDGAPLEREAAPYRVDSGQRRGIQHVGPPGSTRGVLFVADYD